MFRAEDIVSEGDQQQNHVYDLLVVLKHLSAGRQCQQNDNSLSNELVSEEGQLLIRLLNFLLAVRAWRSTNSSTGLYFVCHYTHPSALRAPVSPSVRHAVAGRRRIAY